MRRVYPSGHVKQALALLPTFIRFAEYGRRLYARIVIGFVVGGVPFVVTIGGHPRPCRCIAE